MRSTIKEKYNPPTKTKPHSTRPYHNRNRLLPDSYKPLSLRQPPQHLLLLLHRQHAKHLHDTRQATVLVAPHQRRDVKRDGVRLHLLDALGDALPVLLVPDRDAHVVGAESRQLAPGLEGLEAGGAAGGELARRGGRHALEDVLLVEAAAQAPVEEAAGVGPDEGHADGVLGLHAAGAVVEVGVLQGDLEVDGQEEGLALGHGVLDLRLLLGGQVLLQGAALEVAVGLVEAGHGLELALLAVLDADDALGLEDTAAGIFVGVHFHELRVDGGVDDDLCCLLAGDSACLED